MLNKTLEFLRIVDAHPSDEKVRKRKESAQELLSQVDSDPDMLMEFAQGVIAGFGSAPFTQESKSVAALIKSIKSRDETLPLDLKENNVELQALAGIALGELLTLRPKNVPTDSAVLAALCFRSALSLRPVVKEKHLRAMLDTLLEASDVDLRIAAKLRRKESTGALQRLEALKKTEPPADPWDVLLPSVRRAVFEATNQAAIDREELETLWWMFASYSEVESKPLAELTASNAAFCAGIELAERALLPPVPSTIGMVRRAVVTDRKATTLAPIPLQDAAKTWTKAMLDALSPSDGSNDEHVSRYPAIFPISWACHRLRTSGEEPVTLGKEFAKATGIPVDTIQSPSDWGSQTFREKIIHRTLAES
jgi:hypothetical protein